MSELERAAAEHARAQAERARREARAEADAKAADARNRELGAAEAREFFAFARRHGTPLFRRYLAVPTDYGQDYRRTEDECALASEWHERMRHFSTSWAVVADGAVFRSAYLRVNSPSVNRRDSRTFWSSEGAATRPFPGGGQYTDRFVAAASALTAPVPLLNNHRTGLQTDGNIGYRL